MVLSCNRNSLRPNLARQKFHPYGPLRTRGASKIKAILLQDHVLYPKCKGSFSQDVKSPESTMADHFNTRKLCQQVTKPTNRKDFLYDQLSCHFSLGGEHEEDQPREDYKTSVTHEDFTLDNVGNQYPEVVGENHCVNWSDMSPAYYQHVPKQSEYHSAFLKSALQPKHPQFPKINTAKVRLPLPVDEKKVNTKVSVCLGSDPKSFMTENDRAFVDPHDPGRKRFLLPSCVDACSHIRHACHLDRNSSCVLRKGDYNNLDPCMDSTFSADFSRIYHSPCSKKAASKEQTQCEDISPWQKGQPDTDACHTWEEHISSAQDNAPNNSVGEDEELENNQPEKYPLKDAQHKRPSSCMCALKGQEVIQPCTTCLPEGQDLCLQWGVHPKGCTCAIGKLLDEENIDQDQKYQGLHPEMPKLIMHWLNYHVPIKYRAGADVKKHHKSAHFKLGSDEDVDRSMYAKDFVKGTHVQLCKPAISEPPMDSQVLQNEPLFQAMGETTSAVEFGPGTYVLASALNTGIKEERKKKKVPTATLR